jgi:hypothetical protein
VTVSGASCLTEPEKEEWNVSAVFRQSSPRALGKARATFSSVDNLISSAWFSIRNIVVFFTGDGPLSTLFMFSASHQLIEVFRNFGFKSETFPAGRM